MPSPTIAAMFAQRSESTSGIRPDDVVEAPRLARLPGVRHGFFTRAGGVSEGLYAGLNAGIGSNDARPAVLENRARASAYLGVEADALTTPWQIHSAVVVAVDAPFAGDRPKADAIVTRVPSLAIGVVTADCGPVLFCDAEAGVAGAAHAGWRGAVGGVLEATIDAMEALGAARGRIVAVLGPTITQPNYEVGAGMAEDVVAGDAQAAAFFAAGASDDKRLFDLPGLILSRLRRAGVEADFVGRCTYADEAAFYSFRRTTHRGEPDYGRQLSAIIVER